MRRYPFFIFSLGLTLALNIYFRTFTIYFPQLKTQARNIVEQETLQGVINYIDRKFPQFNALAKDKLINIALSEYHRHRESSLRNKVDKEYHRLKDRYQDINGQTYLMELDCWHWARYVDNVYRSGRPGDTVVNGRQLDKLMLVPHGAYLAWASFLFYFSARSYNLFSLIYKTVPVFTFLFYLPLFLATVFIILLYLLCFYRWGNLGAVVSCLFVGLSPVFLARSCAGWFDMDVLNLLFPLLICWAYIRSYSAFSRERILWLCLGAFWLGLFSFTWLDWWFIFIVIIAYEIYSLIWLILRHYFYREDNLVLLSQRLYSLSLFILFSFFWVIIFSGFQPWKALSSQLRAALSLNESLTPSVWPNVLSTVSELKKADILKIAGLTGGSVLFAFSLGCMLMLFLRTLRRRQKFTVFEREFISVLFFWFLGMCFACFKGIRFTMFLTVPLGISLGWALSEAYRYIKDRKVLVSFFGLGFSLLLGVQFIDNATDRANHLFPLMTDTWHKALVELRQKTSPEAVVNSWWDFGDWFKVVAKRPVIFDGQTQNIPQAYWMANVLTTNHEKEALAILRMLNNGGNDAFETINKFVRDPIFSVTLLKKVISSSPEEAREALRKFLPSQDAEEVVRLVFNKPPADAYFVVDYTMLIKIASIYSLGNWDFAKVYLTKNLKPEAKPLDYLVRLGIGKAEAKRLYQEADIISPENLSRWVSNRFKFRSSLLKGQEKGSIVLFNNGMVYCPKERVVYLYSSDNSSYRIPKSLFLFDKNSLEEITYPEYDLDYSVLVFRVGQEYQAVLLDSELAKSMLVRLYFLKGAGLKHFKPFLEERDGDDYIRVFAIDWSQK